MLANQLRPGNVQQSFNGQRPVRSISVAPCYFAPIKFHLVAPAIPDHSDEAFIDARQKACIGPIADLIFSHLSADPALFGMKHSNEISSAPIKGGEWMLIRSLVTCLAVSYGYDGQAFVCLPTDADPIVSPDESLITVEECSHLLIDSDWMDGLAEG